MRREPTNQPTNQPTNLPAGVFVCSVRAAVTGCPTTAVNRRTLRCEFALLSSRPEASGLSSPSRLGVCLPRLKPDVLFASKRMTVVGAEDAAAMVDNSGYRSAPGERGSMRNSGSGGGRGEDDSNGGGGGGGDGARKPACLRKGSWLWAGRGACRTAMMVAVSLMFAFAGRVGVEAGWIDEDTKDEFRTIRSQHDGAEYELVSVVGGCGRCSRLMRLLLVLC